MSRILQWALALAICFGPMIADAQELDLSDLPEAALTATEIAMEIRGGKGDEDSTRMVPVWIYVNGEGLSAPALQRLRDAWNCQVDETSSRMTRAICALRRSGIAGGKPFKAAGTREWVTYALVPRVWYRRVKGCTADGTCNQSGRLVLFAGRWDTIAGHPRCEDFFPPITYYAGTPNEFTREFCGVDGDGFSLHDPPVRFGGIDPNLGRPSE